MIGSATITNALHQLYGGRTQEEIPEQITLFYKQFMDELSEMILDSWPSSSEIKQQLVTFYYTLFPLLVALEELSIDEEELKERLRQQVHIVLFEELARNAEGPSSHFLSEFKDKTLEVAAEMYIHFTPDINAISQSPAGEMLANIAADTDNYILGMRGLFSMAAHLDEQLLMPEARQHYREHLIGNVILPLVLIVEKQAERLGIDRVSELLTLPEDATFEEIYDVLEKAHRVYAGLTLLGLICKSSEVFKAAFGNLNTLGDIVRRLIPDSASVGVKFRHGLVAILSERQIVQPMAMLFEPTVTGEDLLLAFYEIYKLSTGVKL